MADGLSGERRRWPRGGRAQLDVVLPVPAVLVAVAHHPAVARTRPHPRDAVRRPRTREHLR